MASQVLLSSSACDRRQRVAAFVVSLLALLCSPPPAAAQSPAAPLTLVSPGARQALESIEVEGRRLVPLRALATLFELDLRDDSATGTLTLGSGAGEVLLTAGERLVSAGGRLVSLGSPPREIDGRWWVPLDFINRALAPIARRRVEVRPRSGLVLLGDVDVPRVAARYRPARAQRAAAGRDDAGHPPSGHRGAGTPPDPIRCRRDRRRSAVPGARGDRPQHRSRRGAPRPDDRARPGVRLVPRDAAGDLRRRGAHRHRPCGLRRRRRPRQRPPAREPPAARDGRRRPRARALRSDPAATAPTRRRCPISPPRPSAPSSSTRGTAAPTRARTGRTERSRRT